MYSFNGILYGGHLPLVGVATDASFRGDKFYLDHTRQFVLVNAVKLRIGGFDHNELYLDWQDEEGVHFSLKACDKDDIAHIITHAPTVLQEQMKHWHRRRRSIRFVWTSLGTLAALITVFVGLLWWRYDDALNWVANHISVENERRIGEHVLEQMEADTEIIRKGPAIDAIASIGNRLTQHSRYKYEWLVQKDADINAFALPGGIIVVNSALVLNTDSPEELAAVLAHEVQHVEERHSLKSMLNSLGFAAALLVVLGDVNAATAIIVHQMGNMYFSRDIEEQADKKGFLALVNAGILPEGMISFLKKLQNENNESGSGAREWLSTHPDTKRRIENIQDLNQQQPCNACQPLNYDWEKILGDSGLLPRQSG